MGPCLVSTFQSHSPGRLQTLVVTEGLKFLFCSFSFFFFFPTSNFDTSCKIVILKYYNFKSPTQGGMSLPRTQHTHGAGFLALVWLLAVGNNINEYSFSLTPVFFPPLPPGCLFLYLRAWLVLLLQFSPTGASLFKSVLVMVAERSHFKAYTMKAEVLYYEL